MTEYLKYGASVQVCQNICFPVPGDVCGSVVVGRVGLAQIAWCIYEDTFYALKVESFLL